VIFLVGVTYLIRFTIDMILERERFSSSAYSLSKTLGDSLRSRWIFSYSFFDFWLS